jgi:hypothetical protein
MVHHNARLRQVDENGVNRKDELVADSHMSNGAYNEHLCLYYPLARYVQRDVVCIILPIGVHHVIPMTMGGVSLAKQPLFIRAQLLISMVNYLISLSCSYR